MRNRKKRTAILSMIIFITQIASPTIAYGEEGFPVDGETASSASASFISMEEEAYPSAEDRSIPEDLCKNTLDEQKPDDEYDSEFADESDVFTEAFTEGDAISNEAFSEEVLTDSLPVSEDSFGEKETVYADAYNDELAGFISTEEDRGDVESGYRNNDEPILSFSHINPLYEDILDESDLPPIQEELPALYGLREVSYTWEEAVEIFRDALMNWESSISVLMDPAEKSKIDSNWLIRAFEEACKHTGDPTGGDYIRWTYTAFQGQVLATYDSETKEVIGYRLKISISYNTTQEQEAELANKIQNLFQELNIESLPDDYSKIRKLYDYICANVQYDYEHPASYRLKYTAYAALLNGTAVCQGYATLFYRMALELGIDCRLIAGKADVTGENHGWNIVRIGDLYYNLDATWDSSTTSHDTYFLKNNYRFGLDGLGQSDRKHRRFYEYDTEEFNTIYPMAEHSYHPDCIAGGHANVMEYAEKPATCVQDGLTGGKYCEMCDTIVEAASVIPAHGHTVKVVPEVAATCSAEGQSSYTICEDPDCGLQLTIPGTLQKIAHNVSVKRVDPTCTASGWEQVKTCRGCGRIWYEGELPMADHTEMCSKETVPASFDEDGSTEEISCRQCKSVLQESEKIPRLDKFALSETSFVYDGKEHCPDITVTDCNGDVVSDMYYSILSPIEPIEAGSYSITVEFQDRYQGSKDVTYTIGKAEQKLQSGNLKKSLGSADFTLPVNRIQGNGLLTYSSSNPKAAVIDKYGKISLKSVGTTTITVNASAAANFNAAQIRIALHVLPPKTSFKKLSNPSSGKLYCKWKKISNISGYKVQIGVNKDFTGLQKTYKIKGASKLTGTIKKLKKNQYYYVRIRTYKNLNGLQYRSDWSSPVRVKLKK
ncbi:MAG: hypothetical protein HUJ72_07380 [Blautia sp.]|nr:hypothetical protein [Blautia sp.]